MRHRTEEFLAGKALEMVSPFVDRLTRFMVAFSGSFDFGRASSHNENSSKSSDELDDIICYYCRICCFAISGFQGVESSYSGSYSHVCSCDGCICRYKYSAASIFANRLAVHVLLRHLLQENYFRNLRVARVVVDLKTELRVAIYGIVEQDRKYNESYYNCYYRILVERITFWHIYAPASFNDYTGWE